jgi:hypothetical protein
MAVRSRKPAVNLYHKLRAEQWRRAIDGRVRHEGGDERPAMIRRRASMPGMETRQPVA